MNFLALLPALLQAGTALGGLFQKRPRAPKLPEYPGYTPEQEKNILDAMRRRIGEQTTQTTGRARTTAASRGYYRSGLLPKLETEIQTAGNRDWSEAQAGWEINKADRFANWQKAMSGVREDRYGGELDRYYDMMGAAGQNLGNIDWEEIAKMFTKRPTRSGVIGNPMKRSMGW